MRNKRFALLGAVIVLTLAVLACSDGGTGGWTGAGLSAHETAVAQATRDAMQASARATAEAIANQAEGTRQTVNLAATQQQATLEATRAVYHLEQTRTAGAATATAVALESTRTAEQWRATTTAEAVRQTVTAGEVSATATAVSAAARAVAIRADWDEATLTLRKVVVGVLLLAGLVAVGGLVTYFLPVIRARLGAIYRDVRGDFPALAVPGPGGGLAVFNPAKSWGPVTVIGQGEVTSPLLAPIPLQDAQSKRADFVDWRKGGRPSTVMLTPGPGPSPGGEQWRDVTPTSEEYSPPWPDQVNLLDLFRTRAPSLNTLAIGVTVRENGQQDVVGASLHELMHVLNVGASGWGKSTWLRAFVWQLAMAQEPVNVVAIDVSGSEFNLLRHWEKLLYPVARTTQDAVAVLNEVSGELVRRRELFEAVPLASSLTEYNRLTGQSLPPLVVLADEGAALLNEGKTGEYLRDAIQTARQYGIYCLLATVAATHRTIDTGIRDQFSTRICFRTSPSSSGVVLDDRRAGELSTKGRAWVQLTGRELVQIQGPWVSRNDLIRALQPGGPVKGMPTTADQREANDQAATIRKLAADGLNPTKIAEQVFGYANGRTVDQVNKVLEVTTT